MPLIADKMFILNVTISVKLPPNSGYLLITDKFFKTRRCPLSRGFAIQRNCAWESFALSLFLTWKIVISEPYCQNLKQVILKYCKLQIVFKGQNKVLNAFRLKDCIPKKLTSGVVYKFQSGLCTESY